MRYFNTHGPVNRQEHYVVSRQALVDQLVGQIRQGKFFTIYAPRQMGKTTLLRALDEKLDALNDHLSLTVSFEAYESWSLSDFWADFSERIAYQLTSAFQSKFPEHVKEVEEIISPQVAVDERTFQRFFRQLYRLLPQLKIVLIIDEFDATPQELLSPLLQTWRTMYLDRQPPHSLHSVVLIGIQNIARLNFGRSSPFNIAYQHRLQEFSLDEVRNLLTQYTTETGQTFANGVVEKLYEQTAGQPFLVNRTAAILTEEVVNDRARTIQIEDLRTALQKFIRESNYNFETITRRAAEYESDVINIIFGSKYPFTLNDPLVKSLHLFGLVKETENGLCTITNPIYKQVLIDYFRPREMGLQGALLANGHDFRPYIVHGHLHMELILTRFREFVERRGREAFKITPMPQEATGQYLLMAYLDVVVRQIGADHFSEVNSGEGRLDLIVVHKGVRHIIETKIWRGQALYEEGLAQLADYLASEGQEVGYYVLFHARPNVYGKLPEEVLEFTMQVHRKKIFVYLVRLGHLFEET